MLFFLLSKTLDLLVAPITWTLALVLLGAWWCRRGRVKAGVRAIVGGAAVLYVCSLASVAGLAQRWIEAGAVTTMREGVTYDVVVVLGGMADGKVISDLGEPDFQDGVDRLLAAYDVLRKDRAKHVLVTSEPNEAPALGKQLVDWGIPAERVLVESRSLNTRGNALGSAQIIRERGWTEILLITSAFHMPRAAGCFRAVGLTFDTLAADRRAGEVKFAIAPRAEHLTQVTEAIREAVGRVVYSLLGYTR